MCCRSSTCKLHIETLLMAQRFHSVILDVNTNQSIILHLKIVSQHSMLQCNTTHHLVNSGKLNDVFVRIRTQLTQFDSEVSYHLTLFSVHAKVECSNFFTVTNRYNRTHYSIGIESTYNVYYMFCNALARRSKTVSGVRKRRWRFPI